MAQCSIPNNRAAVLYFICVATTSQSIQRVLHHESREEVDLDLKRAMGGGKVFYTDRSIISVSNDSEGSPFAFVTSK
jgi:hypothetical protein